MILRSFINSIDLAIDLPLVHQKIILTRVSCTRGRVILGQRVSLTHSVLDIQLGIPLTKGNTNTMKARNCEFQFERV